MSEGALVSVHGLTGPVDARMGRETEKELGDLFAFDEDVAVRILVGKGQIKLVALPGGGLSFFYSERGIRIGHGEGQPFSGNTFFIRFFKIHGKKLPDFLFFHGCFHLFAERRFFNNNAFKTPHQNPVDPENHGRQTGTFQKAVFKRVNLPPARILRVLMGTTSRIRSVRRGFTTPSRQNRETFKNTRLAISRSLFTVSLSFVAGSINNPENLSCKNYVNPPSENVSGKTWPGSGRQNKRRA